MTNSKKIGVAFIGAGIVAEMHGRGVARCKQAEFMGAFDPDSAKAKAIGSKFGGQAFESMEQLLDDPRVEAVHVLTPLKAHLRCALAALGAGKHVLIEKPVSHEVNDLTKLKVAAAKADRVCMPAHNYIYVPSIQRTKRLIDDGRLGDIYAMWIIWNYYHSEEVGARYGSVLQQTCVHHAYSVLYLLGKPTQVTAMKSCVHYEGIDVDDQASIICKMPNGAMANLWCSFAFDDPTSDPWMALYKVIGSKGGTCYTWSDAQLKDDSGPLRGVPCYEDGFLGEVDHFINRCIIAGEPPLSTIDDAIDALKIIQTAERAIDTEHCAVQIEY